MTKKIAIAGAGISGMSSAWLLVNNGYDVTIFSKSFSPDITSNKAAAFWFPYHIRNDHRGVTWCSRSYEVYKEFAADAATGVSMQLLKKVIPFGQNEPEPVWLQFMPQGTCRILAEAELENGFSKIYEATVPLIETQIFLPWLQAQLEVKGVLFIHEEISDLDQLTTRFDAVVNCTALGARDLCNDEQVIPVRGQVALLSPLPASHPIYLDNDTPFYVVPRKDAVIIGGTYEEQVEAEVTEPATIERLVKNAVAALPHLAKQQVIGSWAGLRPYRKEVRLEIEPGSNIVHNYGHGGSGFTLSFGCAESVLGLVNELIGDNQAKF